MRMRSILGLVATGVALVVCGGSSTPPIDGGSGSDGGSGGDGGGGTCGGVACGTGRLCCGNQCVNPDNDPQNCGTCGMKCTGSTPFCDGTCKPYPACTFDGGSCGGAGSSGFCCGAQCCMMGQLCCKDEGPVQTGATCFTPTTMQPTCPQGCAPQCKSDRNIKHGFAAVSGKDVAETIASIPVSTWSYDGEEARHMGPMAQDFHAAFGLGNTERAYDPIDAHGVAFAGIQGLYEMIQEQNQRLDRLEKENAELRANCR